MEIGSQSLMLQPLAQAGSVRSASDSGSPGASRASSEQTPEDVTSLTLGQALSGDDTRVNRVQALQGQIASGSYQVDAQAVVSKLLDSMTEVA